MRYSALLIFDAALEGVLGLLASPGAATEVTGRIADGRTGEILPARLYIERDADTAFFARCAEATPAGAAVTCDEARGTGGSCPTRATEPAGRGLELLDPRPPLAYFRACFALTLGAWITFPTRFFAMNRGRAARALLSLLFLSHCTPLSAQEWTRFRGPNGTGLSDAATVPATWTEKDYNWRVTLPGLGHSQPVLWGEKIFLTSALEKGHRRLVLCVSAEDGSVLWQRQISSKTHGKHALNSFASSTPAVDAERVYVVFAHPDEQLLIAFDHSGNESWRHKLGSFVSQHGQGTSPILFEDLVILGNEQGQGREGGGDRAASGGGASSAGDAAESYLLALERATGKLRWKTPRETARVSYSTPCVYLPKDGPAQVIFNSLAHGITSVDARTGAPLWDAKCFTMRTCSSPVIAGGIVLGTCGSGGGGNYLVAVRAGGNGDVLATHEAYRLDDAIPYVPTPLVKGDRVFTFSDRVAVASCFEASTGKTVWQQRVGLQFWASPVCVADRIYGVARDGQVLVIAAADEYREIARVSLGEPSHTTPAVAGGRIYFRTFSERDDCTHLISLGGKKLAAN